MKEMLKTEDLAKWLQISPWTIRSWTSAKIIPRVPGLGRIVRYDPDQIRNWLESGGVEAARERARKTQDHDG